jgi:hypothetical protein
MSATAMELHEWIADFEASIPDIHPIGACRVHELFADMHAAADEGDTKEVARLTEMIQHRVAWEQQWHEEKLAHIRTMKTANAKHPR